MLTALYGWFRREIRDGDRCPRWFAVGWIDHERGRCVCWRRPFQRAAVLLRHLWLGLRPRAAFAHEKMICRVGAAMGRQVETKAAFDQGVVAGLIKARKLAEERVIVHGIMLDGEGAVGRKSIIKPGG